jgi:hypothetical protein
MNVIGFIFCGILALIMFWVSNIYFRASKVYNTAAPIGVGFFGAGIFSGLLSVAMLL